MGPARGALALLLLVLSPLGQAGADRVYRVQAGDTLYSLARRSGTTPQALMQLNALTGSGLRLGQALRLPGGPAPVVRDAVPAQDRALPEALPARPAPVFQSGMAVYYGGRRDARTPLTAAHLTLPKGTWVEVTHARTGRSVLVLINDRGPFGHPERVIDLSAAAAQALGIMGEGVAPVTLRIARTP